METFLKDVQYAVRALVRQPVFYALVILIQALGIAGTACVFSVVNTLVLRPSSFKEPDRLIHLQSSIPKKNVKPLAGRPLCEVSFPRGSLVGAVIRGDETAVPDGDTVVGPGDKVVLFALSGVARDVQQMFVTPSE